MNKVSIIIPAYNKQEAILETLDSVFCQTFNDFEVLVIDDGSTDRTAEVVQAYSNDIIYLHQDNQGQGAARNTGIQAATGRYIVFLDADDYWEPTFLQSCYDFLEEHSDLVAVNTAQRTIYDKQKSVIHPKALIDKNPVVIEDFFKVWAEHDHIRTGTAMIRMETVKQAGLQNPNLRVSQDLEYWGLIATYGKWGFIPEPLWVGNSRMHAMKTGWTEKYKIRRKLCPDVEEWEKRILPRIAEDDFDAFSLVRGRVALGYAHNKILGGHAKEGKHIVHKYQSSFPKGQIMTSLLKFGSLNALFWTISIKVIRIKERLKDI
ncbi:MAG: glycosyltransferase family 2 protein [Winogradskyella sp.]|uniref:glycosyltransferase family 2 protein n=1 Tax=Winogradskyella sp. TaxID=1883156 RepID=UPI0038588728